MDRIAEPHAVVDVVPPASAKTVFTLQFAGLIACTLASLTALFGVSPGPLTTLILTVVAGGMLAATYGLFFDPTWVPELVDKYGLDSPFG